MGSFGGQWIHGNWPARAIGVQWTYMGGRAMMVISLNRYVGNICPSLKGSSIRKKQLYFTLKGSAFYDYHQFLNSF